MVKATYQDALRKLWDGLCDIYVLKAYTNKANGRTAQKETRILHNEPCRISYSSIASTASQNDAAEVRQVIKLFIAKDIEIPEGAKLAITQEGRTEVYKRSGKPAVYSAHQEVILEIFKEYA